MIINEAPLTPHAAAAQLDPDEVVAAAIGQGWSLSRQREVAGLLGMPIGDVKAIRHRLLQAEVKEHAARPATELAADWRLRVRWAQAASLAAENFGALTRLLSLEGKHLGLEAAIKIEHSGQVAGMTPEEIIARRTAVLERAQDSATATKH